MLGTKKVQVYHALCPTKSLPKPRQAVLRSLFDPEVNSQKLDANALVLFFPAPQTATGEDVLELHVHGGNAVVKAILGAIPRTKQPRVRYAEPGEFTRRAFYNNRLDLTEVEALGDTLAAETEQQRQLAIRGASSTLAVRYEDWRRQLLYARGELEALIDFSEDQQFDDSPDSLLKSVTAQVQNLKTLLQTSIQNAFRGELLRNGISVALVGAPNAGKSSLLNRIVKREAAIVSKEAGTTRDVVEVGVDIGGFFCRFGDLAGLRRSCGPALPIGEIEMEGMRRARERALNADVVIVVLCIEDSSPKICVPPEVAAVLHDLNREKQEVIYVINKADLLAPTTQRDIITKSVSEQLTENHLPLSLQPIVLLSCLEPSKTANTRGETYKVQDLLESLIRSFQARTSPTSPEKLASSGQHISNDSWAESLGASERHRVLLEQCLSHLNDFLEIASNAHSGHLDTFEHADIDVVIAAECLRNAADCLAKITGRGEGGDVEEVLGVVFEKFVQISPLVAT